MPLSSSDHKDVVRLQDELNDLSGTHPFRQDGKVYFYQRTAAIVGRKIDIPQ